MYGSESRRCRRVDQDLGRTAPFKVRGYCRGSRAWKSASHKEGENMSQFEKFVTEGNEKADELAKAGAMLVGGFLALANAIQQEREDVYAALQYAASIHCLVEEWKDCEESKPKPKEKWIFVDKTNEQTKHRTEWCAEAQKYRCRRCLHEDVRKVHRTAILGEELWKDEKAAPERS